MIIPYMVAYLQFTVLHLFLFATFHYGSAYYKVPYVGLYAVCIILSQRLASAILICVENLNSVLDRIILTNCYNVKILSNMQEVSGTIPTVSQLRSEGRNHLL
jgi:hypothetical protein